MYKAGGVKALASCYLVIIFLFPIRNFNTILISFVTISDLVCRRFRAMPHFTLTGLYREHGDWGELNRSKVKAFQYPYYKSRPIPFYPSVHTNI